MLTNEELELELTEQKEKLSLLEQKNLDLTNSINGLKDRITICEDDTKYINETRRLHEDNL